MTTSKWTGVLAAVLLLAAGAPAADVKSLHPQGYVNDFAHVLDDQTRTRLEQYSAEVERATGAQMAIVTVDSLDGNPVEDYANALYRQWGVGKKGKDEGVLILLAIQDHKDRIEVGYGLEPVLPDGFVGSVLREERSYLQQNQYGQALVAASTAIGMRVADSKGVSLNDAPVRRYRREPQRTRTLPWPVLVLGIVALLFLMRRGGGGGGGFLAGMLLGNVLGRSNDRWGGGGFGGSDSGGGGFGGFGGGDSGGGGASGDW